jgi:hypothetical protein
VTDCWAWENFFLGMKIAGSIANEVRPAGPDGLFRRTHVGRSGFELAQAGSRLALEVQDMTNPGLRTYPNPSPGNCARCAFVPPCLALNEGADVASIVEAFYRRRTHSASEEPRIGRSTWAMSRGATLRKHRQDGSS